MSDCEHDNFQGRVAVARLTDDDGKLTGFHASIKIACDDCQQEFVFLGVPTVGMSFDQVMVSPGGEELRVPIAPGYAWTGEGKPSELRGFAVKRVI